MSKKLLAGGIVRDLEFDSKESLDLYVASLADKWQEYKILDVYTRADGTVIIRILGQYNNSPLIQLFEEDLADD